MRNLWSEDDVTPGELVGDDVVVHRSATSDAYLEESDRMREAAERAEDDECMPLLPDDDDIDVLPELDADEVSA